MNFFKIFQIPIEKLGFGWTKLSMRRQDIVQAKQSVPTYIHSMNISETAI